MSPNKRSKTDQRLGRLVSAAACLVLILGAALAFWSAQAVRSQVADQFNQQQLVIARNAAEFLRREIEMLKKELLLLKKDVCAVPFDPEVNYWAIQRTLSRVVEAGVLKIEIADRRGAKSFVYTARRLWEVNTTLADPWDRMPPDRPMGADAVWISSRDLTRRGSASIWPRPWPTIRPSCSAST